MMGVRSKTLIIFSLLLAGLIVVQALAFRGIIGNTFSYLEESQALLNLERITQVYSYLSLIITGLLFWLACMVLLERRVLSRLTGLSNGIRNIKETGDLSLRVPAGGRYEILELGNGINEMLETLERLRDEQDEKEEKIQFLAFCDGLTGLYNRTFFEEQMNRLMEELPEPTSIMVIDIDGLKVINDTLGHQVDDRLLVKAAELILQGLGDKGIVCRTGGDEFCAIMQEVGASEALAYENQIFSMVKWFNESRPAVPLSLSIGTATSGQTGADIYEVYQQADNRMYQCKFTRAASPKSRIIDMLLTALVERDFISQGHVVRLVDMAERISARMALSEAERRNLILLAKVHDLGKIGIPDEILLKPGPLDDKEYNRMKEHTKIGYNIASRIKELWPIADLILHHHERWDGKGYPDGLKGEEIPLICRIMAVLDAFDAMTNDRPYHLAISQEKALEELKRCAGTQFDPRLVVEFLKMVEAKE